MSHPRNNPSIVSVITLIGPGLLFFIIGILFPLIVSAWLGFTNFNGFAETEFVGIANYRQILLDDPIFWLSLRNALLLGIGYVVIQHPIAIILSFMIDKLSKRSEMFFRSLFFVPAIVSVVVSVRLWVHILNPNFGLLNTMLEALGLDFLARTWLGDPSTALGSVIAMSIWIGFGYGFLFYYAGIKGIDKQLYEAAKIDGAGPVQILVKITLPLLRPVISVNVILAMISALKQMEIVYLSTGGGPGSSTEFLATYLYSRAFRTSQYGYANAISVLFAIICIVIAATTRRITREKP